MCSPHPAPKDNRNADTGSASRQAVAQQPPIIAVIDDDVSMCQGRFPEAGQHRHISILAPFDLEPDARCDPLPKFRNQFGIVDPCLGDPENGRNHTLWPSTSFFLYKHTCTLYAGMLIHFSKRSKSEPAQKLRRGRILQPSPLSRKLRDQLHFT